MMQMLALLIATAGCALLALAGKLSPDLLDDE